MSRRVLLMDNGSLEPASTRQLRRLAAELTVRVGERVDPVSLAHSAKVPPEQLGGVPGELLGAALERCAKERVKEVVVAPLFIGPSQAIMRHAPAIAAARTELRVSFVPPLFVAGEKRLGRILTEEVRGALIARGQVRVAVVDHGSPAPAVTEVRDAVAAQVRGLLGEEVREVAACSMERRPGAEFDFNEPLLERLLAREGWRTGPLVVALLFVGPGRHAGMEGDVAQIVSGARSGSMDNVRFTRVMGTHPLLVDILVDRIREAGTVR